MSRKLKLISMLFAVCALSGVATASASASQFHSELSTTTFLHGNQVGINEFTTLAGVVKCQKATFEGTQTGSTATQVEITPTYSECRAFGQAATVTTNSCVYRFTSLTATTATVEVCATGGNITVDVPSGNCSLTITQHTPTNDIVDLKGEGTGTTRDLLVTSTVSGIKYTVDGPGTNCGTIGAHTDGTYHGVVTLKGYENALHTIQRGIWSE